MSKKMAKTVPFGSTTPRPDAVDLYKVPHEAASRSSQNPNALPFPVDPVTGKKRDHSPGAVGEGRSRASSLASTAATKTVQGKKDHTHCKERIAALEKELRNITMERHPPTIAITPCEESDSITITMLQSKLDVFENLKVDFDCLKAEMELIKESQQKELEARENQHKTELEDIQAATREHIQRLENNLQQLGAQHDAESEQIKFEYGRQIDELHQNHTAALARIESEHSARINEIQAAHQDQLSRLEVSRAQLESECSGLHKECEEIGVTLETKVCENKELKTQLLFEQEKLGTVFQVLQKKP